MAKSQRKANGGFELSESPSHLIRRCAQYFGDLYAHEPGASELTKQQFTLLAALENNEGVSQTALVEITGIYRYSTAESVRRMLYNSLLSRERTADDLRAKAVAMSPSWRQALRSTRTALERAENPTLHALSLPERQRF